MSGLAGVIAVPGLGLLIPQQFLVYQRWCWPWVSLSKTVFVCVCCFNFNTFNWILKGVLLLILRKSIWDERLLCSRSFNWLPIFSFSFVVVVGGVELMCVLDQPLACLWFLTVCVRTQGSCRFSSLFCLVGRSDVNHDSYMYNFWFWFFGFNWGWITGQGHWRLPCSSLLFFSHSSLWLFQTYVCISPKTKTSVILTSRLFYDLSLKFFDSTFFKSSCGWRSY